MWGRNQCMLKHTFEPWTTLCTASRQSSPGVKDHLSVRELKSAGPRPYGSSPVRSWLFPYEASLLARRLRPFFLSIPDPYSGVLQCRASSRCERVGPFLSRGIRISPIRQARELRIYVQSCPHPPCTNPIHISTRPPHPRL